MKCACLLLALLACGCASMFRPHVVFVPDPDAPVRAGHDLVGHVYVWNGKEWELSSNPVKIAEGMYIWSRSRPAQQEVPK